MTTPVLIFAEKPSQALAYGNAFKIKEKTKTHIVLDKCSTFSDGAIITWGIGHLVELQTPEEYDEKYKKWSIDNLPIIPEGSFKYKPSANKVSHYKSVAKLMKESKAIYIATDIDREGELIARLVMKQAGVQDKPVKRLWINSLETDEIRKGFNQLRDGKETYNLYIEAQSRQQADWLVGMNLSPLYSLVLQEKGFRGSLSIGRVQTPTVYMIYERQKEIENFVSKPFYEIHAEFQSQQGKYKGKANVKCDTKEEIEAIYHEFELKNEDEGYIQSVEKKEKRKKPPKLHSLSTLQTKANKIWKYSPSDVLKTVQRLYEKKIISYPRTDSNFITESEFSYLVNNLNEYMQIANVEFQPLSKEPNKRYVDNSKVEEHYAIIPTKTVPNKQKIESLSDKEKNIYFEIINSTLGMFHHDYVYEETTIITNVKNLEFKTTGTIEKQKGWKELSNESEKSKDNKLPPVKKSEEVNATLDVKEGYTTPPKHYTEGQLINLMKTAGKHVEDENEVDILKEIEGIGTEATRASIIERIKQQKYIEVKKNNVYVTGKGKILCEAIKGTLLSSPSMTAKWETYLKQIGQGKGNKESFLNNTIKFINKMIEEVPKTNNEKINELLKDENKVDGLCKCPSCNGEIIDKGKFYGCSGYKEGCKVTFPKKLAKKNITKTMIKTLCEKGKTNKLKGFKSKNGKDFETQLILNDKHEIKFNFN